MFKYKKRYPRLEEALRNGAKIHVFRSGGALRVVSVENEKNKEISYGEHPYFSEALAHAESDFGLTYKEQYSGKNAKRTHYLSGSYPQAGDVMDAYLCSGWTLDILYSKKWDAFVCISDLSEMRRERLKRDEDAIYGSSTDILSAICVCLTNPTYKDRKSLMEDIS